ncbi:Cytoplasmic copper homeostasis protein cutC [Candidatus Rhodobacter oscarellae]|uniref:PF03932 family protein CutC n=1 Tax=Candidatus Rhodobacter oscarellae TaxID=1675527 RepID=A0A0J9H456_9RHOB|nr:copper homeostasis protein CutC [Candidatus Rhodobacter lobularis]KMW60478.1 Cytoplasmic copper homeostasis protein cutC [Candidatus Rhodobacter lobularis]
MSAPKLEVCIDDIAGLQACVAGGADRIELCSALDLGGLTPSYGFMQAAASVEVPVRAMIRPRPGDFSYTAQEVEAMCQDIGVARQMGLDGVVFGASAGGGTLDLPTLQQLCNAAEGMGVTLHRVVDTLDDPVAAVEAAIGLGFDTILTSGKALTAPLGQDVVAGLVQHAAGRIAIMAGSGVTQENAHQLAAHTGAPWLHASCSGKRRNGSTIVELGFGAAEARFTDPTKIRAIKTQLAEPATQI